MGVLYGVVSDVVLCKEAALGVGPIMFLAYINELIYTL